MDSSTIDHSESDSQPVTTGPSMAVDLHSPPVSRARRETVVGLVARESDYLGFLVEEGGGSALSESAGMALPTQGAIGAATHLGQALSGFIGLLPAFTTCSVSHAMSLRRGEVDFDEFKERLSDDIQSATLNNTPWIAVGTLLASMPYAAPAVFAVRVSAFAVGGLLTARDDRKVMELIRELERQLMTAEIRENPLKGLAIHHEVLSKSAE
jgi:hypothetical protein